MNRVIQKSHPGLANSLSSLLFQFLLIIAIIYSCHANQLNCHTPTLGEFVSNWGKPSDIPDILPPEPEQVDAIAECDCTKNSWCLYCWGSCPRWLGEEGTDLAGRVSRMMQARIVGQSAAIDKISSAIRKMTHDQPTSMHFVGDNATGKTLAATILRDALFQKTSKNGGYLYIRGNSYASSQSSTIEKFREDLSLKIKKQLSICPQSLIIIDELEAMHPSTILVFEQFLDLTFFDDSKNLNEQDQDAKRAKEAIFVFISDYGAEGATAEDSPEQLIARAVAESTRTWSTSRTTSLIQHVIPFVSATKTGAYQYTRQLLDGLFSHPYLTSTKLELAGIYLCPSDNGIDQLAESVWKTTIEGPFSKENYRGIRKSFDDLVVAPFLDGASKIYLEQKRQRKEHKENTIIYLSICAYGRDKPAVHVQRISCAELKAKNKLKPEL